MERIFVVSKISKFEDELKACMLIISDNFNKEFFLQQSPRLTSENKRLKSENRALSRVVSKLGTAAMSPEGYEDGVW